jgi:hypothetical protein
VRSDLAGPHKGQILERVGGCLATSVSTVCLVVLVAAWFTAGATGLLAIFAVVTAVFAKKAFYKQSEEVGLIRDQVKDQEDERKREADERRRAQAERVDMTWTNNEPNFDVDDGTAKSMVTVINGSRRPIRHVNCKAYSPNPDSDGQAAFIELELDYSAELIPDPGVDSFTFPERALMAVPWIATLRGGTRAGFQFRGTRGSSHFWYALVEFTDDAGNRWSLKSDMSLRHLESPPVSAKPSAPSTSRRPRWRFYRREDKKARTADNVP